MIINKTNAFIFLICTMLFTLSYGMEQPNPIQIKTIALWKAAEQEKLTGADLINAILIKTLPIAEGILSKSESKKLQEERENAIYALKDISTKPGFDKQGVDSQNIDALAQQVILAKEAMKKIIREHNDQWPYESVPTDQWNEAVAQEAIRVSKTHNIYPEGILAIINEIIDRRAQTKGSVNDEKSSWLSTVRNPLGYQLIGNAKENIEQALQKRTKIESQKIEAQKKEAVEAPKIALQIQQEKEQKTHEQNQEQIITLWNKAKGKLFQGKPFTGNMLLNDILINSLTAIDPKDTKKEKAEKEAKNNALISILQTIQLGENGLPSDIKQITDIEKMTDIEKIKAIEQNKAIKAIKDDINVLADKVLKAKMAMNAYIHNADNEWPANKIPTPQWNNTITKKAMLLSAASKINLKGLLDIINEIIDQKAMTKRHIYAPLQLTPTYSSLSPELIATAKTNITRAIIAKRKPKPTSEIEPQQIVTPTKIAEKAVLPQTQPAAGPAKLVPTKTGNAIVPEESSTTPTQPDQTKAEKVPVSPQGEPSITETTQFIPTKSSKKPVTKRTTGKKRTTRRRITRRRTTRRRGQPVKRTTQPEKRST